MVNSFSEHPSQYFMDFTWSYLGEPEIDGNTLRVLVRKFGVGKGFPNYTEDRNYEECILVYEGVTSSIRKLGEYGEPEEINGKRWHKIKSNRTIIDGSFPKVNRDQFLFFLEGASIDLKAWVSWEIVAASVRVEEVE